MPLRALARRALRMLPVVGRIARQRDELTRMMNMLWQPPGHFYSPIPPLEEIHRDERRIFGPQGLPGIELNDRAQLALLDQLARVATPDASNGGAPATRRYRGGNPAFGPIDALVWSAMLRLLRPRRVIEVGSGYSTAVLLDTLDAAGLQAAVTLIEPWPQLVRQLLRPSDAVELRESRLQDVPLGLFESLAAGDVLFIDSTHVSRTGSDVNYAVFDILPRLASGVYVHIHDVFYPFEYPREWVYQGRAWNEAYLVRAFLQFNDAFRIALWPSYLRAEHGAPFARVFPAPQAPAFEFDAASLWLRKE